MHRGSKTATLGLHCNVAPKFGIVIVRAELLCHEFACPHSHTERGVPEAHSTVAIFFSPLVPEQSYSLLCSHTYTSGVKTGLYRLRMLCLKTLRAYHISYRGQRDLREANQSINPLRRLSITLHEKFIM